MYQSVPLGERPISTCYIRKSLVSRDIVPDNHYNRSRHLSVVVPKKLTLTGPTCSLCLTVVPDLKGSDSCGHVPTPVDGIDLGTRGSEDTPDVLSETPIWDRYTDGFPVDPV